MASVKKDPDYIWKRWPSDPTPPFTRIAGEFYQDSKQDKILSKSMFKKMVMVGLMVNVERESVRKYQQTLTPTEVEELWKKYCTGDMAVVRIKSHRAVLFTGTYVTGVKKSLTTTELKSDDITTFADIQSGAYAESKKPAGYKKDGSADSFSFDINSDGSKLTSAEKETLIKKAEAMAIINGSTKESAKLIDEIDRLTAVISLSGYDDRVPCLYVGSIEKNKFVPQPVKDKNSKKGTFESSKMVVVNKEDANEVGHESPLDTASNYIVKDGDDTKKDTNEGNVQTVNKKIRKKRKKARRKNNFY